ncbi:MULTISPECIES: phosphoribosyl-AMP cyclohydrolase [Halomonadaceae]|mgnify:CR=1 FL=1|uniref:phosphoribosyl-AMP cyclohydrolase n=1 Tax=Halomonadaceae TaxID=28256 RepID=UPI001581CA9D|nr:MULTISPECIES: phosphoribosyl-AMP cyclohydrolase [Halomonas]MDI4638420.1 phosphoribosyl-AMP cyclohydrolase [Halomonas sp. BMC7]NUJ59408.1 phosphoribosyl-AMP cyclohydrolase [Halomonas taeanensis]|tara:strand:+ start:67899 stop:68339 length:441 start_codon:yes stop_codon:yes gene_type:complete
MSDVFKRLERVPTGTRESLATILDNIGWNDAGLIPAIAQQHDSGDVLMMAWMNRQSLQETLTTGWVCYWSRSRGKLWRKGESSGQMQILKAAHLDCDGDTLLLSVDQTGPACHTGRRSCFYVALDDDGAQIEGDTLIDPDQLYARS